MPAVLAIGGGALAAGEKETADPAGDVQSGHADPAGEVDHQGPGEE